MYYASMRPGITPCIEWYKIKIIKVYDVGTYEYTSNMLKYAKYAQFNTGFVYSYFYHLTTLLQPYHRKESKDGKERVEKMESMEGVEVKKHVKWCGISDRLHIMTTLTPLPRFEEYPCNVQGTFDLMMSMRYSYPYYDNEDEEWDEEREEQNMERERFILGCLIYHQLLYCEYLHLEYDNDTY